jgi:hypothetical protein
MRSSCRFVIAASLLFSTGCSTINDSLQLGATAGFASGAVATYAGYSAGGTKPNLETVAMGAGIGMGLGLLASYLVHRSVEEDRAQYSSDQTEMHFGDLPPNPFLVPKMPTRKAVKK